MATRLRDYSRHWAAKTASFVLFVACVTAFAVTGGRFDAEWDGKGGSFNDYFAGRAVIDSEYLYQRVDRQLRDLLTAAGWWAGSQEESDREARNNAFYLDGLEGVRYYIRTPYRTTSNYSMSAENYTQHPVWFLQEGNREANTNLYGRWAIWSYSLPSYNNHNSGILSPAPPEFSYYDDYNYRSYYYPDGIDVVENAQRQEEWEEYENALWEYNDAINAEREAFYMQYETRFALSGAYIDSLAIEYTAYESIFWKFTGQLIFFGLTALFCLIHSLAVCGRRPETGGVHLSFWDKPWLDVLLGGIILYSALSFLWLDDLFRFGFNNTVGDRFMSYVGTQTVLWAALALWWLLSAVKRIKARSFWRHTLIYSVLAWIFRPVVRFFRAVFNNLPLAAQIGFCSLLYGLPIFLFTIAAVYDADWLIALFFWIPAAIVFFIWKAIHLSNVAKGLSRLAKGDYQTPVEEKGHGALKIMAQNVNAATDGLKAAVEKELTSQRFKAELITNVSHDLRTPLTSVITYAGLLQSEGLSSPEAEKYLEIIQNKARRLQTLTEDLFEASKASSGETRAVLEPLDAGQLIEQTLGEMGDRLSAAQLDVRVSGSCGTVLADGRLLCRVFENLLRNIEKYALTGTRVYIDKAVEDGKAVLTLRNISAMPLDGEAGRLTERFTRGDEARSTEGSGLGLAIVRSFMELQKGSCSIAVDGDLFKVVLTLPLA